MVLILGLTEVSIILLICVSGVGIRTYMGTAGKSLSEFSFRELFRTFVIGLLTSIAVVGSVIEQLPDDMTATSQLIVVAGQIGTVIGVDYIAKKGILKIKSKEIPQ